jgi:hypothetical protein
VKMKPCRQPAKEHPAFCPGTIARTIVARRYERERIERPSKYGCVSSDLAFFSQMQST